MLGWQQNILLRLQARDAQSNVHCDIIDDYRRLAAQTAVLKERNRSLLQAASSARSTSGLSTTDDKSAATLRSGDNPVRQAYVASLESQVAAVREELAGLYKTQAQNAQRLVNLTEQLQTDSDKHSAEHNELIQLRSERMLREREREELLRVRREKDKNIEVLQDEMAMIRLECDMVEQRNQALQEDNAGLLRRWLEKKAEEVKAMDRMLEASPNAMSNQKLP